MSQKVLSVNSRKRNSVCPGYVLEEQQVAHRRRSQLNFEDAVGRGDQLLQLIAVEACEQVESLGSGELFELPCPSELL